VGDVCVYLSYLPFLSDTLIIRSAWRFVLCALCFVLCALCFVLCALCFVALKNRWVWMWIWIWCGVVGLSLWLV